VVAIDGPAGAGKSSVTRAVAQRLHYTRVDTGALYRAVGYFAVQAGARPEDPEEATAVARELAADGVLFMFPAGDQTGLRVRGEDVSQAIRAQEVGLLASVVSRHAGVREALLDLQRNLGRSGGVVLEGRDIGTVVFPDAEVKFFLTASPEVRAQRRVLELSAKGTPASFEEVLAEVLERDRRDTSRELAPLVQAEDAIAVDSSGLSLEEVVELLVARVREVERRLGAATP